MSMSRRFAVLSAIFAVTLASIPANAVTLSLVGSSTKVCQLTGDVDWTTGQPTVARTLTNFGLDAVDLGFPVDGSAGAPLYFLFGDAWPTQHPPGSFPTVPPDDALGWTTRTTPPNPTTCLELQLSTSAPQTFAHPTVTPQIQQGSFNVPTGGVFMDNSLYGFFWTSHCLIPGPLPPDPAAPLTRPSTSATCAQTAFNNSIGQSVIARASPANPIQFQQTVPQPPATVALPPVGMPSGFVYVSAAQPVEGRYHLKFQQPQIPVFGAARYRASSLYLAMAPQATFGDPTTWSFYAGSMGENPIWISRAQWESGHSGAHWVPPAGAEIFTPPPIGQRCVGEHSVTWNAPLQAWLMLYNCVSVIEARAANNPWGPWSLPIVLLNSQDPNVQCVLVMSPSGCPSSQRNYWQPLGADPPGFFYAPFVLNRYTQDSTQTSQPKTATIYWLVSTWNPYEVIVMQSTLQATNFTYRQPYPWPIYRQPLPMRPPPAPGREPPPPPPSERTDQPPTF